MRTIDRRMFGKETLASLLTFSLLDALAGSDALAAEVRPVTAEWLKQVNQLGLDLTGEKIKQSDWQQQVQKLFARVSLPELLEMVDFEKLAAAADLPDKGARSLRFSFARLEGVPDDFSFGRQIFAVKKGRSVVPHGHNNMATAFLVLKGQFHGRHYDRLEDLPEHYVIKPTIDETFAAGGCSTVSDVKDNVHWFKSLEEPSYIFNIHVIHRLPESTKSTGRVYLDPLGEALEGGLIRAGKIDYKTATERFG